MIVEAVVDLFESSMSTKVMLEQATEFALLLTRGKLNQEQIALTVFADQVRELI